MKVKRLMLLFTWGVTLEAWEKQGIMDRELAYYERMFEGGVEKIDLMTYGHGRIKSNIDSRFNILPKKWANHNLIYSLIAPFAYWRSFKDCDIIKTNQSQGAWVGWLVKLLLWRKKLVVRCGWVRTEQMMRRDEKRSGLNLKWHKLVEWAAFNFANAIIVVSAIDKNYIVERYGVKKDMITIIQNSVDITLYQFSTTKTWGNQKKRIMLIGRLVEMKNFQSVLRAVDGIEEIGEVVIAGEGPYREKLETIVAQISTKVTFLSSIPNDDIPVHLRKSDIFVLPQFYASGMPKVLLEAMAVGTVTISSNIPTHRYLINDGENGFLCEDNIKSIKKALSSACQLQEHDYQKIVKKARVDVEYSHDMAVNANRELRLYDSLIA